MNKLNIPHLNRGDFVIIGGHTFSIERDIHRYTLSNFKTGILRKEIEIGTILGGVCVIYRNGGVSDSFLFSLNKLNSEGLYKILTEIIAK